ncbi:uncharacterized protein [Amphiura filiformis]|uniref:uncharacterized protein n=1 Tax=Amphiura filiformis TaxID=82378 RepID=UPI003B22529D
MITRYTLNTSIMATSAEGFAFIRPDDITVGKFLAGGGFGGVSLATHKSWGEVAIKQFNGITLDDEILKEAKKMWRGITCPYLVRVMGVIEDPGKPLSIVMEVLEYGDLRKFNQKFMMGGNCWARKIKMIQEIALAMNFLHTQTPPVIHRDLKLENVMVGNGFCVKVGDLGLALSTKTVQYMQSVRVAGTFSHIPPEGYSSEKTKPDKFWDIWTYAITLFEFVSGKDAWLGHAEPTLVAVWLLTGKRPDMNQIPSDVPKEIVALIERCWDAKPSDRPQFQEIQESVTHLYQSQFKSTIRRADRVLMEIVETVTEAPEAKKVQKIQDSGKGESVGSDFWRTSGEVSVRAKVAALNLSSHSETKKPSRDSDFLKTNTTISPTKPRLPKSDAALMGRTEEAMASKDSGIGSQHSKEWKLMQTFGQEGDKDGEFRRALGIAVCKNGDIVVTNVNLAMQTSQAYMFNSNGTYKFTFQSHPTNPEGKLLYPKRVAVTPGGDIVISDQSNLVKLFSVSGDYLKSLSTVTAECNNSTKYDTCGVAIFPSGVVYVGDLDRQVITVHDMDRQQPIKKLSVDIKPWYISSDPDNNIWVSDWQTRQVIRYSDSGVELCRIKSFIVDNEAGQPRGAVYGKGSVYIAVIEANEKTGGAFANTGHIHQYTMNGQFQRCIIKGMYAPCGIAMSNGKIYVANRKSVLVYEQQ